MKKVLAITIVLLGLFSCKITKHNKGVFYDQTVDPVDTISVTEMRDTTTENLIQTGLFRLERISNSFHFSKEFKKDFSHAILVTTISDFRIYSYEVRKPTTDKEVLGWAGRRPFSENEFLVAFEELFKMQSRGRPVFLSNRKPNIFHVQTADKRLVAVDIWYQSGEWCFHSRPLNSSWVSGGRMFLRRRFDR